MGNLELFPLELDGYADRLHRRVCAKQIQLGNSNANVS